MLDAIVIWDLEDDPDGNVQHIAEHGITMEEVEEILLNPKSSTTVSKSSELPITFGHTSSGRYLAVVYEHLDDDPWMLRPVTAYDAPEPRRLQR